MSLGGGLLFWIIWAALVGSAAWMLAKSAINDAISNGPLDDGEMMAPRGERGGNTTRGAIVRHADTGHNHDGSTINR